MNFRRDPIYISHEVWRWLRLLAKADKAHPKNAQDSAASGIAMITPDEIADQILRQAIREQHPQLPEHQKEIDKLEKKLVETLRK